MGGKIVNIQKEMSELFGNACYAYCIAWLFSDAVLRNDVKTLTRSVVQGWCNGYIEDDGFVASPVLYANQILGRNVYRDVKKVKISSLSELPEGNYAVEYDYGTKKHFVVCNKSGIVFDSWPESNCVKYGKPTSYRLYI